MELIIRAMALEQVLLDWVPRALKRSKRQAAFIAALKALRHPKAIPSTKV
jgi:hypothetical protein